MKRIFFMLVVVAALTTMSVRADTCKLEEETLFANATLGQDVAGTLTWSDWPKTEPVTTLEISGRYPTNAELDEWLDRDYAVLRFTDITKDQDEIDRVIEHLCDDTTVVWRTCDSASECAARVEEDCPDQCVTTQVFNAPAGHCYGTCCDGSSVDVVCGYQ